ncbi:MAG: hypothetical protein L3J89_13785 [Gammaproteobacteria bacterium]|nr:hypothetical protein [Gammaproteobacteria bacterium]
MASVKSIVNCLGIDTGGTVSVLGDLFGFIRRRVPADPDGTVTARVSVLGQIRGVQQNHIHVNVIRVGFDALADPADLDDEFEKIDYATYRMRNIYAQVNLGVGRVWHYFIPAADADGMDDIASGDEADDLIAKWSVPNVGVDAFVVRNIDGFLGMASGIPGSCDKESKEDGVLAGDIGRGTEGFARTFAHEIGHHLGLEHNHGGRPDCPDTLNGCNNIMAQTRCATSCGGGIRAASLLANGQGSDMRGHCAVRNGCDV